MDQLPQYHQATPQYMMGTQNYPPGAYHQARPPGRVGMPYNHNNYRHMAPQSGYFVKPPESPQVMGYPQQQQQQQQPHPQQQQRYFNPNYVEQHQNVNGMVRHPHYEHTLMTQHRQQFQPMYSEHYEPKPLQHHYGNAMDTSHVMKTVHASYADNHATTTTCTMGPKAVISQWDHTSRCHDNQAVTMTTMSKDTTPCLFSVSQTQQLQPPVPTTAVAAARPPPPPVANVVITVPFGWKRVLENGAVVYYSPSGYRLPSVSHIQQYLLSDGTCKCGLECPLVLDKTFSFNSQVSSKPWNPQEPNDLTKLCNHKRKILAMATLHSSTNFSDHHGNRFDAFPPDANLVKKAKKKRKRKSKTKDEEPDEVFPDPPVPPLDQGLTLKQIGAEFYNSQMREVKAEETKPVFDEPCGFPGNQPDPSGGFPPNRVLLSPGGTPMLPNHHAMSNMLQHIADNPQFNNQFKPQRRKKSAKKLNTLLERKPPCPNVDVRQIILEQQQQLQAEAEAKERLQLQPQESDTRNISSPQFHPCPTQSSVYNYIQAKRMRSPVTSPHMIHQHPPRMPQPPAVQFPPPEPQEKSFPASHLLTAAARGHKDEAPPNIASDNPTVASLLQKCQMEQSPIQMVQNMISGLETTTNNPLGLASLYGPCSDRRRKSGSSESGTQRSLSRSSELELKCNTPKTDDHSRSFHGTPDSQIRTSVSHVPPQQHVENPLQVNTSVHSQTFTNNSNSLHLQQSHMNSQSHPPPPLPPQHMHSQSHHMYTQSHPMHSSQSQSHPPPPQPPHSAPAPAPAQRSCDQAEAAEAPPCDTEQRKPKRKRDRSKRSQPSTVATMLQQAQHSNSQMVVLPNMQTQVMQPQPYQEIRQSFVQPMGINISPGQVNFSQGQIELSHSFAAQDPTKPQMNFVPIQCHLNLNPAQFVSPVPAMNVIQSIEPNVMQYQEIVNRQPGSMLLDGNPNASHSSASVIIHNGGIVQPVVNGIMMEPALQHQQIYQVAPAPTQELPTTAVSLATVEESGDFNDEEDKEDNLSESVNSAIQALEAEEEHSPQEKSEYNHHPFSPDEDSPLPNPLNLTEAVSAVVKSQPIFGEYLDHTELQLPKKKTRGFSRKFRPFNRIKTKRRFRNQMAELSSENQVNEDEVYQISDSTSPQPQEQVESPFNVQGFLSSKINGNQSSDSANSTSTVEGDEARRGNSPSPPVACLSDDPPDPLHLHRSRKTVLIDEEGRQDGYDDAFIDEEDDDEDDDDDDEDEDDDEDDEEEEDEEEESEPQTIRSFNVGDVVWGQTRGFPSWPGKLVNSSDVKSTQKTETGKLWVKWFGDHSCTQVAPDTLKTLSEGLEAHYKSHQKQRKGRKLNINLEAAIQEAMNELDRQANNVVTKATEDADEKGEDDIMVDSNDNTTKLQNICLLRSARKRKSRTSH